MMVAHGGRGVEGMLSLCTGLALLVMGLLDPGFSHI